MNFCQPRNSLDFGAVEKVPDAFRNSRISSQALAEGKPIDLSGMPPPPHLLGTQAPPKSAPKVENPDDNELDVKDDPSIYKAPPAAETILESLEQRLAKYEVGPAF